MAELRQKRSLRHIVAARKPEESLAIHAKNWQLKFPNTTLSGKDYGRWFDMIDILKEIILDFQEIDLPTGVPRRVAVFAVAGKATDHVARMMIPGFPPTSLPRMATSSEQSSPWIP